MYNKKQLTEHPVKTDSSSNNSSGITIIMLMQWLAQGNGIAKYKDGEIVSNIIGPSIEESSLDKPIRKEIVIRKFQDDTWHVPTKEYMGFV